MPGLVKPDLSKYEESFPLLPPELATLGGDGRRSKDRRSSSKDRRSSKDCGDSTKGSKDNAAEAAHPRLRAAGHRGSMHGKDHLHAIKLSKRQSLSAAQGSKNSKDGEGKRSTVVSDQAISSTVARRASKEKDSAAAAGAAAATPMRGDKRRELKRIARGETPTLQRGNSKDHPRLSSKDRALGTTAFG